MVRMRCNEQLQAVILWTTQGWDVINNFELWYYEQLKVMMQWETQNDDKMNNSGLWDLNASKSAKNEDCNSQL